MDKGTLEVLFSRQIERSVQCTKLFDKYETEAQEPPFERSYDKLRKMVDLHLSVQARKKQRKMQQNRSGTALAATSDKNKGVCNQWKKNGACSRGADCGYVHPPDQKGTGKGKKGKGNGKCKDKKSKGSGNASANSHYSNKSDYRSSNHGGWKYSTVHAT